MTYFVELGDIGKRPKSQHLYLAEGDAEVGLIESYLRLRNEDPEIHTVICFKGLSRLGSQSNTMVKLIKQSVGSIDRFKSVMVAADAEENPLFRRDSVIACAKAFHFPHAAKDIIDSGVHTFNGRVFTYSFSPHYHESGMIEDLIFREIINKALFKCLSESFVCLSSAMELSITKKAVVGMYISAASNSDLSGIRRAFDRGIFNCEDEAYRIHTRAIDIARNAT